MINLSSFHTIVESTFTDRLTVKRFTTVIGEDRTTKNELKTIPEYDKIPCRISFTQTDNPGPGTDTHIGLNRQVKLFISTAINVQKGDYIIAERMNSQAVVEVYEGRVNKPFTYLTHKELLFLEDGEA